jgi:hypothetical protein
MPKIIYTDKDGVRLPSVTTVISNLGWNTRSLMHWAWKQGWEQKDYKEEKQAAANIGTVAHKLIEIDVTQGIVVPSDIETLRYRFGNETVDKALIAFSGYERWRDSEEFQSLTAEESLISETMRCGGTLDHYMVFAVGLVRGKRSILDVKVTRDIYPEHIIQVSTYGAMRNECHPDEPIEELHFLKLGKEEPSFAHEMMQFSVDLEMLGRLENFYRDLKIGGKSNQAVMAFWHLRQLHDLRKGIR